MRIEKVAARVGRVKQDEWAVDVCALECGKCCGGASSCAAQYAG
jgi:hypothetical protein